MNVPDELRYALSDEWAKVEGDVVTLGVTDYAQHELGEIVYVELPQIGDNVSSGTSFGVVESVKAVAELMSPVDGEVIASNAALPDDPSLINESPFEKGWMIRVCVTDAAPLEQLMDADAYREYRD